MRVLQLGRIRYASAHDKMVEVLSDRILERCSDTLILCEHEPVFTLGTQRNAQHNVHDPGDTPVVPVRRGGDVTFHGPGQLVGYPILRLPEDRLDLHGYLRGIEQVLIDCLDVFGVTGTRDQRNTGVWVEGKKIAAIGIACKRWVTWHGFALNLTTDLSFYQRINPCGMDSNLVTRLSDHVHPCPSPADVTEQVVTKMASWWTDWAH